MNIEVTNRRAGLAVPYLHGAIDLAGDQVATVRAERCDLQWQVGFSWCGREKIIFPFGPRVPDPDCVDARRRDAMGLRVPGETEDYSPLAIEPLVTSVFAIFIARFRVPNFHNAITARRCNPA